MINISQPTLVALLCALAAGLHLEASAAPKSRTRAASKEAGESTAAAATVERTNYAHKQSGFVGVPVGLSSVDNNVGTGLAYGIHGGYFTKDNIGIGALIRGGNHANGINSFFMALEGLYRFENVPGLHAGLVVGTGKFSAGGFSGDSSLTYGFKGAYDIPISTKDPITAGVDLSMMFLEPRTTLLSALSPVATLKWWL